MATLLEEALKIKRKIRGADYSKEEVELAVEWARGNLSFYQIVKVTGKNGSNVYNFLSKALQKYFQSNKL